MGIFKLSSTRSTNILLALLSVFVVLVLPSASMAMEVSPVVMPEGDSTPLDIFAGLGLGFDSNPARTEDASSETLMKAQVGIAYRGGGALLKYDFGFVFDSNMYLDNSDYDFGESKMGLGATYATQKLGFNVSYDTEQLEEPQDADTIGLPSFERTTNRLGVGAKYNFGSSNISLDYSSNQLDIADEALDYIEHTSSGLNINVELGKKSSHALIRVSQKQIEFASFDPANARYDFDSMDTLVGWQSVTQNRSILVGAGSQSLAGSDAAFNDASATTFNTSLDMKLGGGSSSLRFALASSLEPSASAQHKEAMRYAAVFERKANARSAWSLALDGEQSKNVDALENTTDISLMTFSFGYSRSLGSPESMHGIFYSKLGLEQSEVYTRNVLTIGIALGM